LPSTKSAQIKEQARGLSLSEATFAPPRSSPFSRYVSADFRLSSTKVDSWSIRDFHTWDSVGFLAWPVKNQNDCNACWAYAVVASVEAAYGIAKQQSAPRLSVEPLFALMGLSDSNKCTAGGSPTQAFEMLVALDASSGLTGDSDPATRYPVRAFEWAQFKGYVGLMLAVQRQPVVVHIEASAATFIMYDGVSEPLQLSPSMDPICYTGSLNHVVLVIGYFITRNDGSQKRIAPPFWIIRNSWGEEWGGRGHMRMDIQGGDGVCGINALPGIYPIVKKAPGSSAGRTSSVMALVCMDSKHAVYRHFKVAFESVSENGTKRCAYCNFKFVGGMYRCAQHITSWNGMRRREVHLCTEAPKTARDAVKAVYEFRLKAREAKRAAEIAAVGAVNGGGSDKKKTRMTDFYGDEAACAKQAADEALCLLFAALHISEHPLWRNAVSSIARAGTGYVPPKRHYIGGAGLARCRQRIEAALGPIAASWRRDSVTIASDMFSDTAVRPQANVLLINDSGAVFVESIDTKMEIKTGGYIAGILRPIIEKVGPENVVAVF
ncbi:unnamed protein product, partial [Closterium sp. Naga37s-1]